MVPGKNAEKRQRNCQCEREIQTEGGKIESYAYDRQDVDVQEQYNADNMGESVVNPNPMVMIINENQKFPSDQLTIR